MPKPSPTVSTAPIVSTRTQCLPRLRPSQPQNLCTCRSPSRAGGDATQAMAMSTTAFRPESGRGRAIDLVEDRDTGRGPLVVHQQRGDRPLEAGVDRVEP